MDIRGKKLLVIGGAGLVGSHLVEQLTAEDVGEIIVFDNFTRGTHDNLAAVAGDSRVKIIEGDITRVDILNDVMAGVDGCFHLAALWLLHCHQYPRSGFEVNALGTFNVIDACVRAGVKKLVFSSSASVYGDAVAVPMTEDHPYNNRTIYGATKIAGEHLLRAYHTRDGLDYVGLRYMNIYGPRQDYHGAYVSVIMKVLDRIDQGLPPLIFGDGSQSYDFIYVGDVALANILSMKSDATDLFLNVGMGLKTSINELVHLIIELTGTSLEPEFKEEGQTFVTHRVGSTELARESIGFTAKVPLREGLGKLIEWRKARMKQDALVEAG